MSRRHTFQPSTSRRELLIDCPLDSVNGLLDLISGQYIAGKTAGDVIWDSGEQAYSFKTQATSSGNKGVYLTGINLPYPFDWSTYLYGASFDVKRLNNNGGGFACIAIWWAGQYNRSEAPVYVYYNSGSNEIKLTDTNWHHVEVIWTTTAKDEYLDGVLHYSEPITSVVWERRQYIDYTKFLICGAPFSGFNGVAYMKNLTVWRERL